MSAASFLGIAGLVAMRGYDGMIYATGWLVGWPALMFLIAEPLRNLGKYTFADVVAFRLRQVPVRIASAVGGILTVLFYTIAQMVGAGNLITLLFGIPYEWAVVSVGAVMLAYVLFGGMIATTWVQIIKALLLLFGVSVLTVMVLAQFQFDFGQPLCRGRGALRSGGARAGRPGHRSDRRDLARPRADARPARPAAHPDALLHGARRQGRARLGALRDRLHRLLLPDHPDRRLRRLGAGRPRRDPARSTPGGNMAAPLLAELLGGTPFLGFIAAVAFATILAVVAGLTLAGASRALARHLRARRAQGKSSDAEEVRVARIGTVAFGVAAVLLGILFKGQNVAFMVGLAFAIACSANFPALLLSIVWRRFNTIGAVWSIATGAFMSVLLIVLSPTVWVDLLGNPTAIFPLRNPAIVSMSVAFLVAIVASLVTREPSAEAMFDDEKLRTYLGVGAE